MDTQKALALGWSVFPTNLIKKPLYGFKWGPLQQTRPSQEQVNVWVDMNPAGWAVVTGPLSGLVVLDFDDEEGCEALARMKLNPHVRTASGGFHVYLRHPGYKVKTVNWKTQAKGDHPHVPGIDVRADGGYAVFCGKSEDGEYAWLREPDLLTVGDVPEPERTLLGLLPAQASPEPAPATPPTPVAEEKGADAQTLLRWALDRTAPGCRNETGFQLTCQLRDNGVSQLDAEEAMREYAARCPHDSSNRYTEAEALASLRQAYSQPAREPWRKDRMPDFSGIVTQPATEEEYAPPEAKWQPFPVDALPSILAESIGAGAEAIGCDPSFVAMPMLAACAAAIGNARRVALKRTWSEPSVLWCVVIAPSGQHKSPAHDYALSPLRKREAESVAAHLEAMSDWKARFLEYDKALAKWKRGATEEEPPTEPVQPTCKRLLASDATTEALAALLQDNPRGLLLDRDELNGWIGSFDQYREGRGGDAERWLEMQRAGTLVVDRKTQGTIHVPMASVSVAGGVQPEVFRKAMQGKFTHNGMLARMLLAMPPPAPRIWRDKDVAENVLVRQACLFDELLALTPALDGSPVALPFTPEAKEAWIAFFNRHGQETTELAVDGALGPAWSKLEGYAARLSLLCALSENPQAEAVDLIAVQRGIRLIEWFKHEDRRIYAFLDATEEEDALRKLAAYVERKGGTVTPREVQMNLRAFRERGAARAGLDRLARCGRGAWRETAGKRGPASAVFVLTR